MLLQNPQLAYALLQAQVVMRIVDPEIALVRELRMNGCSPILYGLMFISICCCHHTGILNLDTMP